MLRWTRSIWTGTLGAATRHRPIVLALFSVTASGAISLAIQGGRSAGFWGGVFLITVFLIVLTGVVPSRYAAEPLLAYMLPTIHKVLGLGTHERIAVHHLKSATRQQYEQLTEYFPRQTLPSRGRTFTFSHGIVGQCFKTIHPICWSVPDDVTWEQAMIERWSFSQDELIKLTKDRHSFMVYPLGQDGFFARAVLYLDSDQRNKFSAPNCDQYCKLIEAYFLDQLREALRRA